jgi:hypothetical protein
MAKEIATLASQMRQEEMLDSTAGVALSGDVRVLLAFLFFNVFVCACLCTPHVSCVVCSLLYVCPDIEAFRGIPGVCPVYCVIRSAIHLSCVLLCVRMHPRYVIYTPSCYLYVYIYPLLLYIYTMQCSMCTDALLYRCPVHCYMCFRMYLRCSCWCPHRRCACNAYAMLPELMHAIAIARTETKTE